MSSWETGAGVAEALGEGGGVSGVVCARAGGRCKQNNSKTLPGIAKKYLVMANLLCPEQVCRALSSSYPQRYQKFSAKGFFSSRWLWCRWRAPSRLAPRLSYPPAPRWSLHHPGLAEVLLSHRQTYAKGRIPPLRR